jgi:hypothetical protein
MAKKTDPKEPAPKPEPEPKTMTQAQREFASYKTQGGATQASYGFAPGQGYQAVMHPVAFPQAGQAGPGWAFAPSVAMLSQPAVPGGFYPAMVQPGGFTGGSLADQLGSTLRLGVDAVNAVLVGGIRVLTGFSAYGASEHAWPASQGCSCCGPCETECGGYDCCCVFGEACCRPSVGTCC